MYINEYGNPDFPKIILLAPMMVSGENIYQLMSPYFKDEYCFIAPDQGGHGKVGAYISADAEYRELKGYLLEKGYHDIKLVYGASLGVAIAYRLYLDPDFNMEKAWFDGVALNKKSGFAEWFMRRMFRQRKRKPAKTHAEASEILVKIYGYDFAKIMTKNFERITPEDIDTICYACCHYDLKSFTAKQQKNLHLEYGETDPDYKLSRKAIRNYLLNVTPVIRKGYSHCGYMAAHREEYVSEMERFIRKRESML